MYKKVPRHLLECRRRSYELKVKNAGELSVGFLKEELIFHTSFSLVCTGEKKLKENNKNTGFESFLAPKLSLFVRHTLNVSEIF